MYAMNLPRDLFRFWRALGLVAVVWAAPLVAEEALPSATHEHGRATLELVQEGPALLLRFETPAFNLLGFEYVPMTPVERQKWSQTFKTLTLAHRLFRFSDEAACRLEESEVRMPRSTPASEAASTSTAPSDPAVAPEIHADMGAHFRFGCGTLEALHQLDIQLFRAFPGVQRLTVRHAMAGQSVEVELTAQQSVLQW